MGVRRWCRRRGSTSSATAAFSRPQLASGHRSFPMGPIPRNRSRPIPAAQVGLERRTISFRPRSCADRAQPPPSTELLLGGAHEAGIPGRRSRVCRVPRPHENSRRDPLARGDPGDPPTPRRVRTRSADRGSGYGSRDGSDRAGPRHRLRLRVAIRVPAARGVPGIGVLAAEGGRSRARARRLGPRAPSVRIDPGAGSGGGRARATTRRTSATTSPPAP